MIRRERYRMRESDGQTQIDGETERETKKQTGNPRRRKQFIL